jgi:hypothetical protein
MMVLCRLWDEESDYNLSPNTPSLLSSLPPEILYLVLLAPVAGCAGGPPSARAVPQYSSKYILCWSATGEEYVVYNVQV